MFKVRNTILSDDIATAKFACEVHTCKGACCVVGNAGAPVNRNEIPVLKKAYKLLKDELRSRAREVVEEEGLILGTNTEGFEINCTDGKECVFVTYAEDGVAKCKIQEAYYEGRLNWEKPLSCHLFPVRLKRILDFDYANFEYVPSLCSSGCERGQREGVYLSDFLRAPLTRRYGKGWYNEFLRACDDVRKKEQEETQG
jgi:hypothetical protein